MPAALEDLTFRVEDDPAVSDVAIVDDGLAASTIAAAGQGLPRPLAVFVRDGGGAVLAGIHGWTWGRCCELVSLWVGDALRSRGVATALLRAAEAEARVRDCRQVVLFTHAMQAPQLYIGTGYELVGEVPGYPAGSAAYWFRKRLDQPPAPRLAHVLSAAVRVALAVLVVREVIDELGTLRLRAAHLVSDRWARFERHERRDERHIEMAYLSGRIGRRGDRLTGEPRARLWTSGRCHSVTVR